MSMTRRAVRYVAVLAAVSLVMAFIQWLAAPRGGGAADMVYVLEQGGHARTGAVLRALHESAIVRTADDLWQRVFNAPRNRLLAAFGFIDSPDMIYFYGASHRWPREDLRDALIFAAATTVVFSPVAIAAAWLVTRRTKKDEPPPPPTISADEYSRS